MNLKWILIFIYILTLPSCEENYKEYKYIVALDDYKSYSYYKKKYPDKIIDGLIETDKKLSKEFIDNMIFVLKYYNVKHYISGNKIYVDIKIWKNRELLWNYQRFAEGDLWIKNHKKTE